MFRHMAAYSGDPILKLDEAYQNDPHPHKVNLSIEVQHRRGGGCNDTR